MAGKQALGILMMVVKRVSTAIWENVSLSENTLNTAAKKCEFHSYKVDFPF